MKVSILAALALTAITGWSITLETISSKPSSREKNFLIWQFLHQDINASQASEAFYQIDTVNERFLSDYSCKTDEPEIRYTVDCMHKLAGDLLGIEQDDCLYLALSPVKAQLLQSYERELIAQRLNTKFGNVQWLRTMNLEHQFVPENDLQASLNLFVISNQSYRRDHFNELLDSNVLNTLSGLKGFDKLVYWGVTDLQMTNLDSSLSNLSSGSYDSQTHFYLGLNAYRFHQNENALFHLKEARNKAKSVMEKDKISFWLYRLSSDSTYLDDLVNSLDINMYVLWAREQTGLVTENYFTTLPTSDQHGFRGEDPFEWNRLYQEMVSTTPEKLYTLIDRYDGNDSLAIQAFMLERVYYPYIHNFTMPYDRYMEGMSNDQKAIVYALMRQETQLIPGLVSRSFALGLMQIMPFNVDAIAAVHPLKISSYDDMFNPAYNIPYAREHLKHIEKNLFNPVLMAYAYNGGIGFTKRLLLTPGMFGNGDNEPFLSMEMVSNAESREYGKRVLANYVIYKKILGEPVSIRAIFDNLTQPSQSDLFRASTLVQSQP